MIRFLFFFLFLIPFAHAQIGEVLSLTSDDAYLTRSGAKIVLTQGASLEVGDKVYSESSHVVLILYPKTQISLVRGSELSLSQHFIDDDKEKTTSLIDLIKGLIRMQVTKDGNEKVDQKVGANGVTFAVRGTEFEVSTSDDDAELDVFEGEVEVSSPYVQSFVPEIVKPNEGFRFDRKKKNFARRAMRERNRESRFLKRQELRDRWAQKKTMRQARKNERRQMKEEKQREKREGRAERRQERKRRGQ
jgi:hypothetical protein